MEKSRRLTKDLIGGILFLVIGIAILVAVPQQIKDVGDDYEVGPRYVPLMMGIFISGLSCLLIIKSLIALRRKTAEMISLRSIAPSLEAIAVIILIVAWAIALRFTNYLIVSTIIMVLGLLLFRVRKIRYYVIGVVFVFAVWALFTYVLHVRLP